MLPSQTKLPSLLIVDDQPLIIQLLYKIFQNDYELFMATSGAEALEFCQRTIPDLILLDVVMPEMDGLQVCAHLKKNPDTANIPIIFVTAQDSPQEETRAFEAGAVDFITKPVNPSTVCARVKTHLTLKAQADILRNLAFMDGLTGVANRRYFDQCLETEWRRCARNEQCLSLLLIDIDHFKLYNDHYGHLNGDVCLKTVATTIKQQFRRSSDFVARYGGEEFVCLLPETNIAGARSKAEEIRQAIEQLALPHEASLVKPSVTLSIGVASKIPQNNINPSELICAADQALYTAKNAGRNRVHVIN